VKAARSQRWRVGDRFYRPNPDPAPLEFVVTSLTADYLYFWHPTLDATCTGWHRRGPHYARRVRRLDLYRQTATRQIVRLPQG
jgi:hypothetical protein